jgi:thiol-disulfide isomerase/thioredoxin
MQYFIICAFAGVVLFFGVFASAANKSWHRGVASACLGFEHPKAPEIEQKVPRSQCKTCGGTGRVRTGDGLAFAECHKCEPESGAAPVAEKPARKADMVLVFSTPWCAPCRTYEKTIRSTGLIVKEWSGVVGDGANVWFIDAVKFPDLANRYQVEAVPFTVTLKGDLVTDKRVTYSRDELLGLFQ